MYYYLDLLIKSAVKESFKENSKTVENEEEKELLNNISKVLTNKIIQGVTDHRTLTFYDRHNELVTVTPEPVEEKERETIKENIRKSDYIKFLTKLLYKFSSDTELLNAYCNLEEKKKKEKERD